MGGSSRGQRDLRQMFLIGEISQVYREPQFTNDTQESLQSGPNFVISCKPHENKEFHLIFLNIISAAQGLKLLLLLFAV